MLRIFAAVAMSFFWATGAQANCDGPPIGRSATVARDIGGVALGDDIRGLRARCEVSHVAGEWYQFNSEDAHFEVGVSPLGRIYNITATQKLGRFAPDRQFTFALTAKLTTKFGKPASNQLPGGPAQWGLVEEVRQPDGTVLGRETNWAAMSLSTADGEVTSEMKMVDFRVRWQDEVKLNCDPARQASDKVTF